MTMRKKPLTLILLLATTLLVQACGDNGGVADEESVTTTTATEATTTTADEPTTTTTLSAPSTTIDASTGGPRVIEVVMTDLAFDPVPLNVAAGEAVRFVITNNGAINHEFRLSNAHRIEEHLASGHDDHHDDEGGHHEGGDIFIELEPGETAELDVEFPEDVSLYTEVACLLPGHYEAGMKGDIEYDAS